jgi:LysR family transcriptional regulator (chromosome initiation inhibitor)
LNKEGIQNQLLGYMHYTCVAHPDFAQQHFAQGLNIHAMQNTPAVVYDRKDQLHEDMIARIFQIQHMTFPKIFMPSPECFLDAIVQKCGYGMMPLLQIESELQVNSLIDLTPKHHHAMPLYWCYWSNQAPLYEHLTQYIMAQGSVLLEQDI